mgnify:CR=1 FL=1
MVGYAFINIIMENVVKPRVMGEELHISPLFMMSSLILWRFVLGPIGTILAVPLTLIATKLLLETSEEIRRLAVLLAANPRARRKAKRRGLPASPEDEVEASHQGARTMSEDQDSPD